MSRGSITIFVALAAGAFWLFGLAAYPGKLLDAAWHRQDSFPAIDFYQDWAAGRDHAIGASIYEPLADNYPIHREHLGFTPTRPPVLAVNAHPPTLVMLVLPLAQLDYLTAFRIWSVLGAIAFIASLALALRGTTRLRGARLAVAVTAGTLLATTACPVYRQVLFGNVQMLLLILVTGTWAAARSGRPTLAGICAGIATVVKLYPALLIVHLLLRRQMRAALAAIATVLVLATAAGVVFGFDCYAQFVQRAVPAAASYGGTLPNASVHGFWRKLFDASQREGTFEEVLHSPMLANVAIALSAVALLGLMIRAARRDDPPGDPSFAFSVIVMLLLAPVTWVHGQTVLLLPLVILWARGPRSWGLALTTLVLWLPWRSMIEWRLHEGQSPPTYALWETLTWVSLRCFAMLALLWLAWRAATATGTGPLPTPRTDPSRHRPALDDAGRAAAG